MSLNEKFEKKRLKTLYNQNNIAIPGNLVVAICAIGLFRSQVDRAFLWGWAGTMAAALLFRLLAYRRFSALAHDRITIQPWLFIYVLVSFIFGSLWGVFGIIAYYSAPISYFSIMLVMLSGLCGASVATNALSNRGFLCFAAPAILPLGGVLLASRQFDTMVLGFLMVIYLLLITVSAVQLNRVILQSLAYRYANLQLVADLQQGKTKVMELNQMLEADIQKRIEMEKDKELLIAKLQTALNEVKTLSGLIPICAQCKRVRDDQGYWNQIETYIHQRSGADFSHSICPDCFKKLYPDIKLEPNGQSG